MNEYSLRISLPYTTFTDALLWPEDKLIHKCAEYLIVEEEDDHTHHYYQSKVKIQAMRKRVKSHPNYIAGDPSKSGNAFYSLKSIPTEEDAHRYLCYMCKGTGPNWEPDKPKVCRRSEYFSVDKVKELHAEFWNNQEEFKKAKKAQKELKANKSKRFIQWLDEKYQDLKIKCPLELVPYITEFKFSIGDTGRYDTSHIQLILYYQSIKDVETYNSNLALRIADRVLYRNATPQQHQLAYEYSENAIQQVQYESQKMKKSLQYQIDSLEKEVKHLKKSRAGNLLNIVNFD